MKITDIKLAILSVPLRVPFKTAVRSVDSVEDVIVEIHTDTGHIGYGEAPPTGLVTGDTTGSIIGAFNSHIRQTLIGRDMDDFEKILIDLNLCIQKNTSAKAAADMALYDLYGQLHGLPVYKLLGANRRQIETDITISVNSAEEMARDAKDAFDRGYKTLKVKVGIDPSLDVARLQAIRDAVGKDVKIRIDANQAWTPRMAVKILDEMQEKDLGIELVEQPVRAADLEGLRYVTENSYIPVMADECMYSAEDAMKIIQMRAADIINIKLMKCAGLYNALKICSIAEVNGVDCMIGCMLEAKVSVNAAVHLACAKDVIKYVDLDGPVLCKEDPVDGGSIFKEKDILVSDAPGLGIRSIRGLKYL